MAPWTQEWQSRPGKNGVEGGLHIHLRDHDISAWYEAEQTGRTEQEDSVEKCSNLPVFRVRILYNSVEIDDKI